METLPPTTGNTDLIAIIRGTIADAGGRISFADYMALALTHPVFGYYASGRGAPGRAGADFLTAPETSPYFGRCLAVQVAECWRLLGAPTPFTIWEHGAGAGTLSRTLLDALRENARAAYTATTYWLDDAAPASLTRARTALAAHAEAGHVAWAAPPTGMVGVVLANEFVDALPVHRVRMTDDGLREAYVGWDEAGGRFIETWDGPSMPALSAYFMERGITLVEGQQAEVCLTAQDWITRVTQRIDRGYVMVIDYGDSAPALYRPGRFPDGSLMCYYRHTANRDPYTHVGEQDMTAHVDFSALADAGAAAELDTIGLTTQAAFLSSLGLGELLYAATRQTTDAFGYINERNAVIRLIEPSAMGRNRVLLQGKGVSNEQRLLGLAEPPI